MQKTIENLTKAFIGESQARNRYTMYAKIAEEEGYAEIAANFTLTANQEKEHAKWLMRMINDLKGSNKEYDEIIVEAVAPTILGTTEENLQAGIDGEHYENTTMYPDFANIADDEGLPEVAKRLRSISRAEENHEAKYQVFLENIKKKEVFKKAEEKTWVCRKCGYMHTSKEAMDECPACGHKQAHFELRKENY